MQFISVPRCLVKVQSVVKLKVAVRDYEDEDATTTTTTTQFTQFTKFTQCQQTNTVKTRMYTLTEAVK